MKINEFIKEVNKIAYARYNKDIDELTIYTDIDFVHKDAWFLSMKPHRQKDIIDVHNWNCLFDMDPKELEHVLKLVRELDDTPVDERLDGKPKYYVLDEDLGHVVDVELRHDQLVVKYATVGERQDIDPKLLFKFLSSEYGAVANVFNDLTITRIDNNCKFTYQDCNTPELIQQLITDIGMNH